MITLDQAKADTFATLMLTVLNHGALAFLHPDGIFLMQDVDASSHVHKNLDHPLGPMLYTTSCMHCITVSLALNGEKLSAMWGEEQAHRLLAEAGFPHAEVKRLPRDFQNSDFIATKSEAQ